ncbi:MAG: dTDP-4-dehydrorhamnose 3,5-epimerase family protein [Methanoregula sp.]|jgi:dTDP-4-dehydrorhamnose 3,5-epimerase|uniref:dTDP-4-dehydrorhamnose 3,5-epimerase family protein n=1 Tax=Methanoregula sp. TaxID=2052170 RepID=UPI003C1623FD
MIDGVKIKTLKNISDERGRLMEIMRCDEPVFQKFGQVYLTTNYPGVVKAWHFHKKQTDMICCLKGMIKAVLYDARPDSPTQRELTEFFMGEHNPLLLSIPPGVYHGWKCISAEESLIISIPTEPYDYQHPDEYRLPPDSPDIPYDWILTPGKKHG